MSNAAQKLLDTADDAFRLSSDDVEKGCVNLCVVAFCGSITIYNPIDALTLSR